MTFSDAINNGINAVNKNWMLILINVVATIVVAVGFAIIIIVPLVILFIVIGVDSAASLKDMQPESLFALFSAKYIGLALFFAAIVTVYTIFVMAAMLFIYGATTGVLAKSLSGENYNFSFNAFMLDGKRLFTPMLSYTSLVGLVTIVILIAAAAFLFIFYNVLPSEGVGFAVSFLKYLVLLVVLASVFFIFNWVIALTFYGSAAIASGNLKSVEVFKDCLRVMIENMSTFWFYLFVLFLLVVAKIILLVITVLMSAIPLIGVVFGFTFNILMPVVFMYLTYIFIASLFSYYFDIVRVKADTLDNEIVIEQ